jgi:predicted enzyme related to lactoylglutathione lyase
MGERTSYEPGTFSYVELTTTDSAGAKEFYSGLFGWETHDQQVGDDMTYTMCLLGGKVAGALYESTESPHPAWLSYVTVEEADAAAAKAKDLGANVISEPFDVMTFGRMAVIQDPTGAVFAIWQPRESIGSQVVNDPGALTMNQVNTTDTGAVERFYGELFGWKFQRLTELGDTEGAQFWGIHNGERLNGGMMELEKGLADAGVPSHWLVYFTSADLDASVAKVGDYPGAKVMVPPTEIPAGRFAVAHDPQGAMFALFEGDVDD